jgi:hypothetical protein
MIFEKLRNYLDSNRAEEELTTSQELKASHETLA